MNMDFNVKKIVKDAGAALSRVVQLTEEKLGTSEKTELDAHFENLWDRADITKNFTEKLVRNTEAVLIPNPGNRIEDYIYEKIEKKRLSRLSNLEYLGVDMIEAGTALGPGTAYGGALIKVGQWEQKLGQTERDFIGSAGMCFTQPLRKFLETEMKTILKEKNVLETKRLDLDACKNRVRKARSLLGQPTAERDLRVAQSEFDRQAEILKLLLEGVGSSHAAHLRYLHEFVETQARYYSQCTTIMTDLQREIASVSKPGPVLRLNSEELESVSPNQNSTSYETFTPINLSYAENDKTTVMSDSLPNSPTFDESKFSEDELNSSTYTETKSSDDKMTKARVIRDYVAKDGGELSLKANDIIMVKIISNEEYFLVKINHRQGLVPKNVVEVLT